MMSALRQVCRKHGPRPSTGQGGRARNAGLLPEHWQGSRQGMTDDLALMTASRLVKLYRAGELSPVEATRAALRSEEHTSELQSLMRISYAVFCLNKKKKYT